MSEIYKVTSCGNCTDNHRYLELSQNCMCFCHSIRITKVTDGISKENES